jgi:hypothetical protein
MSIRIVHPTSGHETAVVPEGGTGPTGHIAACVQAFRFETTNRDTITNVYAKVYRKLLTSAPPMPSGLPPGQPRGNDFWYFDHLSDATYDVHPALDNNTIVAWAEVSGTGAMLTDLVTFKGVRATDTDCPPCGSGSGTFPAFAPPPGGGCGCLALATVPLVWTLLAAGFKAGSALLNGSWDMHLRLTEGDFCAWDNGGDGVAIPRVELRCESPVVTTWRLRLRHATTSVEYTRPASEWNPLAANVLHRFGADRVAGAADLITVIPG